MTTPTTDHSTATDAPATVAELRRALESRHGAAGETARLLDSVAVDVVRAEVATKVHTLASRVASNGKCLATNQPGGSLDDRDPLAGVLRDLRELISLYGVAEVLHGRGAQRLDRRGARP